MISLLFSPFLWMGLFAASCTAGFYAWNYEHREVELKEAEMAAYIDKQLAAIELLRTQSADAAKAAEVTAIQKEKDNADKFAVLEARARALPRRDTPFSAAFVGVLNGAVSAANPAPAAPAPVQETGPAAADSSTGLVTDWGIQVAGLYRTCADQVDGLQQFYEALRALNQGEKHE